MSMGVQTIAKLRARIQRIAQPISTELQIDIKEHAFFISAFTLHGEDGVFSFPADVLPALYSFSPHQTAIPP